MRIKLVLAAFAILVVAVVAFVVLVDSSEAPESDVPPGAPLPGQAWDGRGRGNLSEREAEEFKELDIYWLGASYAGYNLQAISYAPQTQEASLIYGSCRLSSGPEPSCPIPLSVSIRPLCFVRPEQAQQGGYSSRPLETLRDGALLLRSRAQGQGTIFWTNDSFVSVQTGDLPPDQVDQLLQDLRKLNRGGAAAGTPLAPPDFSRCR